MIATQRGDIQRVADDFSEALRQRDQDAANEMTRAYAEVRRRLSAEFERLVAEMEQRRRAGETIEHQLQNRFSRASILLRQADAELFEYMRYASAAIVEEQRAAIAAAQSDQARLAAATMGPGPGGITASFNQLPTAALQDLVGTLQDGSPLADLLDEYGARAGAELRRELVAGLARGASPIEIARAMRGAMDGNALRALTVARTETLRAYRESSMRFYRANTDIIGAWVWWSARQETTCAVCWAMHGTRHPLDESFGSHPSCRCTPLPVTKTWKELGFGDVPGDGVLGVPQGEDLLRRKPVQFQRAVLGPGKYAAWKAGEIALADIVKVTRDPRWGVTRSERALRDLLATEGYAQAADD